MTSRFRSELSVVPPVRMAVRRGGLETTIGWSAAGADRSLIGAGLRTIGDPARAGPLPNDRHVIPGSRVDFGGGAIGDMTSAGLAEFKRLLLATAAREREIRVDVRRARLQHALALAGRALAWCTLVPLLSGTARTTTARAVASRRSDIAILRENLAATRISVSFDMETAVADPHRRMLDAFASLASCEGSWALDASQRIDRVKARSMSAVAVERRDARGAAGADPLVDTADPPPRLPIQRGRATAHLYPGFVLVVDAARSDLAVIDLRDLDVRHSPIRFTEDGPPPRDGTMVGKVWAKSNKDGSRDRRFKDNRELPVMLYGELRLEAPGGLREAFQFSRNEPCEALARALTDLARILRATEAPLPAARRRLPAR
jgi:hypothetical protein